MRNSGEHVDLSKELQREVSISRREIVTLIEAVYGQTPQWNFVRSQLLTLLGDRGLEGNLKGVIRENGESEHEIRLNRKN
jgi:hypothetical protein